MFTTTNPNNNPEPAAERVPVTWEQAEAFADALDAIETRYRELFEQAQYLEYDQCMDPTTGDALPVSPERIAQARKLEQQARAISDHPDRILEEACSVSGVDLSAVYCEHEDLEKMLLGLEFVVTREGGGYDFHEVDTAHYDNADCSSVVVYYKASRTWGGDIVAPAVVLPGLATPGEQAEAFAAILEHRLNLAGAHNVEQHRDAAYTAARREIMPAPRIVEWLDREPVPAGHKALEQFELQGGSQIRICADEMGGRYVQTCHPVGDNISLTDWR